MSDIAIRVEHLSKQYRIGRIVPYRTLRDSITGLFRRQAAADEDDRTFWAVNDLSFDVRRGEVLGVIGRNGAGKSTLLKILTRITEPTTGRIEISGRVGSLLEVGTGFHAELTGRENIYLNGAILGMKHAEIASKFDEIVSFAETGAFLDTPVKHYSSGMYMRLAFSVAAHLESEILIVDEVLAVGDLEFQQKCLGKMKDVSSHGRTVLFVSHNMNALEQLCSSVLLLERGRKMARSDDVRGVISQYILPKNPTASTWNNGGSEFDNPYFKPLSFSVVQNADLPEQVWIEIDAEIDVLDPALTMGYAVFHSNGMCMYWSYFTDGKPEDWPKLQRGRQRLRSRLPERFLNEGTYRIELIGGLTNRHWIAEPAVSAPAVFLSVTGNLSDSPLYTVPRPTLLAPIFKWTVEHA